MSCLDLIADIGVGQCSLLCTVLKMPHVTEHMDWGWIAMQSGSLSMSTSLSLSSAIGGVEKSAKGQSVLQKKERHDRCRCRAMGGVQRSVQSYDDTSVPPAVVSPTHMPHARCHSLHESCGPSAAYHRPILLTYRLSAPRWRRTPHQPISSQNGLVEQLSSA